MTKDISKLDVSGQEEQRILFCSQPSIQILIDSINKYERAVQKYIDPEINKDEALLLVADMIDKLAESMPKYLQEDRGMKERIINRIIQMKEKDIQIQEYVKKQVVKLASGIVSMSHKVFAKHVM
jgi:hypothetical protein